MAPQSTLVVRLVRIDIEHKGNVGHLQSVIFGVRNRGGEEAEGVLSDKGVEHWEIEFGVDSGDVHCDGSNGEERRGAENSDLSGKPLLLLSMNKYFF